MIIDLFVYTHTFVDCGFDYRCGWHALLRESGLVYIALRLKTSYFHHFIPHHFCTGKYNLVSCSDVARSNTPCMGFKPPYIFRNTVCVYYYYLCYFNLCTSREAFYICFWTCINCRPPPPPPPPSPRWYAATHHLLHWIPAHS